MADALGAFVARHGHLFGGFDDAVAALADAFDEQPSTVADGLRRFGADVAGLVGIEEDGEPCSGAATGGPAAERSGRRVALRRRRSGARGRLPRRADGRRARTAAGRPSPLGRRAGPPLRRLGRRRVRHHPGWPAVQRPRVAERRGGRRAHGDHRGHDVRVPLHAADPRRSRRRPRRRHRHGRRVQPGQELHDGRADGAGLRLRHRRDRVAGSGRRVGVGAGPSHRAGRSDARHPAAPSSPLARPPTPTNGAGRWPPTASAGSSRAARCGCSSSSSSSTADRRTWRSWTCWPPSPPSAR